MRTNLVPSAIVVFLFWWAILSFQWLFNGQREEWEWHLLTGNAYISLMSVFWGLFLAVGVFLGARLFAKSQVQGERFKGISVSLGPFPNNRKTLPRLKRITPWQPKLSEWTNVYRDKYPAHYALLEAVAEVLEAHPLHPASIEPGGHGDRTLLDHSHFVTEFMLKGAATFDYRGLSIPAGIGEARVKPGADRLVDPLFKFNPNDPLIPIIGLVHDIGKIECYEVTLEGLAIEKRTQHDWRGRFVLTGIPEFWELPTLDQETLLDVVGFYHHPWDVPSSVSERSRSMIDLVLKSDIQAGEYEAAHPRMATKEDIYEMVRRMLKAKGQNPDNAAMPDRGLPYETELAGVHLSLHQSRLLYFFEEMMFDDGAVNGGDMGRRLGFMIGRTIYFNEEAVRERLGSILAAKKLIDLKKVDGQNVLTTELMVVLGLRGSLVNQVDDHEFSPGRALFKVVTKNSDAKSPKEFIWPAIFMVDASRYDDSHLEKIEPIDHEIVSVTPVYGWSQGKKTALKAIPKSTLVPSLVAAREPIDLPPAPTPTVAAPIPASVAMGDLPVEPACQGQDAGTPSAASAPAEHEIATASMTKPLKVEQEDVDLLDAFLSDPMDTSAVDAPQAVHAAKENVTQHRTGSAAEGKADAHRPLASDQSEASIVLNGLHDAGAVKQAEAVQLALEAGSSLPLPGTPQKPKKRDQRRLSRIQGNEGNPASTNLWWEKNNGRDGVNTIISNMMVSRGHGKEISVDGVVHVFFDIDDLMSINQISPLGRDKFLETIRLQEEFVVSKKSGTENGFYVGIKVSTLEAP